MKIDVEHPVLLFIMLCREKISATKQEERRLRRCACRTGPTYIPIMVHIVCIFLLCFLHGTLNIVLAPDAKKKDQHHSLNAIRYVVTHGTSYHNLPTPAPHSRRIHPPLPCT
jgi:hypothetical protein